jgi:hypothetical protein
MTEPHPTGDGRTVTIRIPISIRSRGGRKLVLAPDGTNVTTTPVRRHIDNAMVKAIARAFRWRELLEKRRLPASSSLYLDRALQFNLLRLKRSQLLSEMSNLLVYSAQFGLRLSAK